MSDLVLSSPLESAHLALGARLIPFGGWAMPVQYSSILTEHAAVRHNAGVFDISHMGQIFVSGTHNAVWLDSVLTNNFSQLLPGQGQYTLMLNENGGVIDDMIAYKISETESLLVVNASMISQDLAWLEKHLVAGVGLRNESSEWAGLAIQGPAAVEIFHKLFPQDILPPRNGITTLSEGSIVCRTGYTGEDGYEFFCPAQQGIARFEQFIAAGAIPCGLGARDTLRLEMCYPLNGNDLSPKLSPLEAGLGFFCDLTKPNFIGLSALLSQKEQGLDVKLCAIELTEKGPPPRPHYPILSAEGEILGELSSGVLSPTLGIGIAMAYLPARNSKIGTPLLIDIRGRHFKAITVKKPFFKK